MKFERELKVGLSAIRRAAQVCRSVQASISEDILQKQDRSPVTVADFASQAIVCQALGEAFPDDGMISEEDSAALKSDEHAPFLDRILRELAHVGIEVDGQTLCRWIDHGATTGTGQRCWTLDPIDGTKGFLRGEQYAISLALIEEGVIQLALLGCPNLSSRTEDAAHGCLLAAVRGQGAFVYSLEDETRAPSPIRTSGIARASAARLCESVESGHSAHGTSARIADRLGINRDPVRLDSQAKYAVVAQGEADVYLRLPTRSDYREKIWDHAGGVLVVEEAGGTVTDITGKPLDFSLGAELLGNQGVVVTNGDLHEEVLEAVQAVLNSPASP